MSRARRTLPAIDWAHEGDPWYRVGVWLVIYGGMVAAPTLTVALLLGVLGAVGWLPLGGEFYWLSIVGSGTGAAALLGFALIRRSRDYRQRRREIDDRYWF
ncbi:MAG: hypothetical protein ABEJ23_06880 [Haloarculaceae archaeon]